MKLPGTGGNVRWDDGTKPWTLYIRIAMRLGLFCAPITSHVTQCSPRVLPPPKASTVVRGRERRDLFPFQQAASFSMVRERRQLAYPPPRLYPSLPRSLHPPISSDLPQHPSRARIIHHRDPPLSRPHMLRYGPPSQSSS